MRKRDRRAGDVDGRREDSAAIYRSSKVRSPVLSCSSVSASPSMGSRFARSCRARVL